MNSINNFIMKPKVDFCFKELMSDAEVRRGFIAALLNLEPKEVVDTELLPTHLNRRYKDDKEGILDFELFESEEFYSRFHIWEDSRQELYSDKFEIHILELPKLVKFQYPQTELLRWARFFNGEEKEELKMLAKSDEYVQKAYDKLVDISSDEEKRLEYEAREKAIRDYNNIVSSGWRRGIERGIKQGLEQGIQAMVEVCQEMGVSKEDTAAKVVRKFSVAKDEARDYVEKYWENI